MTRPKSRNELRRHRPQREPYDRVLIVCEGEKTEPNYFHELQAHYRLNNANVAITGEGGSAPNSVVDYAISLFKRDPDYDAVFCVFDCDAHTHYSDAIRRVESTKLARRSGHYKVGNARFEAITSVPCFEYWILLHYQYTTACMERFADVESRLNQVPALANYHKGAKGLFTLTRPFLETALDNAGRANVAAAAARTDNPTTRMPVLIRYLLDLAEKQKR